MPGETTREGMVKLYGPYTATYTGVRPCPYRVQREGVEVFSCALASQVSAYVGRQHDGHHATNAELTALLALATPAPAHGATGDDKSTPTDQLCRWTRDSWDRLIEYGSGTPPAPLVLVLGEAEVFAVRVRRLLARLDNDELTSEHLALLHLAAAREGEAVRIGEEEDEIVTHGVIHLERMSDRHIWANLGGVSFDFVAVKGKLVWRVQGMEWADLPRAYAAIAATNPAPASGGTVTEAMVEAGATVLLDEATLGEANARQWDDAREAVRAIYTAALALREGGDSREAP